jgi:hypothetical protein
MVPFPPKIWVSDPGYGKKLIPDSGVKKAPDPKSATLAVGQVY